MLNDAVQERKVGVERVVQRSDRVFQVVLHSTDRQPLQWQAGQYLQIILPEGSQCAYSIASAPAYGNQHCELHIECQPGHGRAAEVMEHIKSSPTITITLPHGQCHLGDCPQTPLVFIAASTGFAQMKAMIEQALARQHPYPLHFYWGGVRPNDFYMPGLPIHWASEQSVVYHPVLSEADPAESWEGRHGLLFQAVLEDREQLEGANFYICGSPTMVYATYDAFVTAGIAASSIHSDVFDYSPR